MLASLLLYSVHIPHEAPDSRSTFGDFASDESVCPRGDVADTADTAARVADTAARVADTAAHVADTTTHVADTDPRAGTTPAADTESDAGQRIGVWSFVIVSGRAEGRGNSH